jgi:hypothetical protein
MATDQEAVGMVLKIRESGEFLYGLPVSPEGPATDPTDNE